MWPRCVVRRERPASIVDWLWCSVAGDQSGVPTVEFLVLGSVRSWQVSQRVGQGLVEYALIIVLISIAVLASISLLGVHIGQVFERITASLGL